MAELRKERSRLRNGICKLSEVEGAGGPGETRKEADMAALSR